MYHGSVYLHVVIRNILDLLLERKPCDLLSQESAALDVFLY